MRRALTYAGLVLVGLGAVLWLTGALGPLADALQAAQRGAQERLAAAIRALRGGEPGALAAFWAVCFGYGVLHAAGPGHGKLVIGGYGVARRVPVGRLAGLALASSLAQAAVAVGLVYAALAVLGLTRTAVEGAAERWMTPVGHAMIAGLGCGWSGAGCGKCEGEWPASLRRSCRTTRATPTPPAMTITLTTTTTARSATTRMGRRSRRPSGWARSATGWRWSWASRCGPVRGRCSCWS
jgi:hypothetical protein